MSTSSNFRFVMEKSTCELRMSLVSDAVLESDSSSEAKKLRNTVPRRDMLRSPSSNDVKKGQRHLIQKEDAKKHLETVIKHTPGVEQQGEKYQKDGEPVKFESNYLLLQKPFLDLVM